MGWNYESVLRQFNQSNLSSIDQKLLCSIDWIAVEKTKTWIENTKPRQQSCLKNSFEIH